MDLSVAYYRWLTRLRRAVLPALDRLLPESLYAAYTLTPVEHVATVEASPAALATELRCRGYELSTLSALKYHWETGRPAAGSLRRVDHRTPDWQWHVHLFEIAGGTAVTSHYELRPDPSPSAAALRRMYWHYRPRYGETYIRGATDLRLDEALAATRRK